MKIEGFDYVLPDSSILFSPDGASKLGGNIYCTSAVFDKFKKKDSVKIITSNAISKEDKDAKFVRANLSRYLLKVTSFKNEAKYRSIRNLNDKVLDRDMYNHLLVAASLSKNGKRVAVVSEDPLVQKAYGKLLSKNHDLNQDNFVLMGVDSLNKEKNDGKNIESKVASNTDWNNYFDAVDEDEYIYENKDKSEDKKVIDDLQFAYDSLSDLVRGIMNENGNRLLTKNHSRYGERNQHIAEMKDIELQAAKMGYFLGEIKNYKQK